MRLRILFSCFLFNFKRTHITRTGKFNAKLEAHHSSAVIKKSEGKKKRQKNEKKKQTLFA